MMTAAADLTGVVVAPLPVLATSRSLRSGSHSASPVRFLARRHQSAHVLLALTLSACASNGKPSYWTGIRDLTVRLEIVDADAVRTTNSIKTSVETFLGMQQDLV